MHQAIDWFFSHVNSGVILEDDLVLGRSAIPFLSHFLQATSDNRVWMISGNRQSAFGPLSKASLTKIPHIWGWATWAKKWQSHDKELEFWPDFRNSSKFATIFPSKAVSDKFRSEIDTAFSGEVDTWDLGWMASMWSADGFSVRPPMNLITNHGFDHEATHTRQKNHESERPIRELPLKRTSLKRRYGYLSDALEFYELKGSPMVRKFVRKLSNYVSNWEYLQINRG